MKPSKKAAEPLPTMYSVSEVARMFGISAPTVRRWQYSGELPHHKIGRQVRFDRQDLEAFLAKRRNVSRHW